jgi:hypothetical protein
MTTGVRLLLVCSLTGNVVVVAEVVTVVVDVALAQAVSRWLPTAAARGLIPGLVMWDFVVDKLTLG